MGHNITYRKVLSTNDMTKDKALIWSMANEFSAIACDRQENPSGDYHGNLTIHQHTIFDNYDAACDAINGWDKGFYDDHAVRFRDCSAVKPTKAMLNIKSRIDKLSRERYIFDTDSRDAIRAFKSAFITCKKCESKINKGYIGNGLCPVCWNDMRSPTVINRLNNMTDKIALLNAEYKELENKLYDKAPITWVCKFEVHC